MAKVFRGKRAKDAISQKRDQVYQNSEMNTNLEFEQQRNEYIALAKANSDYRSLYFRDNSSKSELLCLYSSLFTMSLSSVSGRSSSLTFYRRDGGGRYW